MYVYVMLVSMIVVCHTIAVDRLYNTGRHYYSMDTIIIICLLLVRSVCCSCQWGMGCVQRRIDLVVAPISIDSMYT